LREKLWQGNEGKNEKWGEKGGGRELVTNITKNEA